MRTPSKITKNNSQGIIFVIISCQRVKKGSEKGSQISRKKSQKGL